MLALLNIGFFEMLILGAAAVMLFGGDLPEVARKAAGMVGKWRRLSQDLTREIHRPDLSRPPELSLRPEDRDVFGKLSEQPRTPFEATPDNPLAPRDVPVEVAGPTPTTPVTDPSGSSAPDDRAGDPHATGSSSSPSGDPDARSATGGPATDPDADRVADGPAAGSDADRATDGADVDPDANRVADGPAADPAAGRVPDARQLRPDDPA